jgi:hypothetical protein
MDLCESVMTEELVPHAVASGLLVGHKRVVFMTRGRNIAY